MLAEKTARNMINTLGKSTANREIVPESWKESNGVLIGYRNGVHTIICGVPIPSIKAEYERRVIDPKTGRNLIKPQEGECHSWVRNHYNHISSVICGINASDATDFIDGNINGKQTNGTVFSAGTYMGNGGNDLESSSYGNFALVTVSTQGIVLGTGEDAESEDSFALTTQVAHGTGAGQLYYATSASPASDYYSSPSHYYKLTRYFDNFSGGTITAKEMAIYAWLYLNGYKAFMVSRDLINPSSGLDIPNLAQAAISYLFSVDLSSSGSRLRNLYNYLITQTMSLNRSDATTFDNGYLNIKDTGGTVRNGALAISPNGTNVNSTTGLYMRVANSNTYGAVVGSNSTAVTINDYILNTIIAHGTGGGQLSYGASEVPVKAWSDPTMTIQQARTMNNGSGGDVTVRESGLIANFSGPYTCLVCRDVFADVTVANGESIRIVHQFQQTYP